MRRIFIYLVTTMIGLTLGYFWTAKPKQVLQSASAVKRGSGPKKEALATTVLHKIPKLGPLVSELPSIEMPKKISLRRISLKKITFSQLPGWTGRGIQHSLTAFQQSCKVFLKQKPTKHVGTQYFDLQAKDWQPACKAALSLNGQSEESAQSFFEKWFYPIEFLKQKSLSGLFTGYYMPQLKGSFKRTQKYNIPIYGLPHRSNWAHYYTRRQIDHGVLDHKAPVLAWIDSPVDRLFLEIEGSGVIKMPNGKSLYLGYAGENGAPYTSIGKVLIQKGVMNRDNASQKAIKQYLEHHSSNMNSLLERNKSFVFFEDLKSSSALGVKDIPLTPGYSLAIDRKWIPLGTPLWLSTEKPEKYTEQTKEFKRLMIAQDTGGAIRGMMRGDIYWGTGKKAAFLGKHMKNEGQYWLLLPKHFFTRLKVT